MVTGRRLVLGNDDVRISYVVAGATSPLYRNAIGDECVYIESGSATVETVFGPLSARPGDYVLLPRATTHRWVPRTAEPLRAYCIEANSHITPARRYLSKFGQLLEHAPYCERDLHGPGDPPRCRPTATAVTPVCTSSTAAPARPASAARSTSRRTTRSTSSAGTGACTRTRSTCRDFEPITGRIHQPPPAHQVFEGNNFVICNFVPRKVDYHPLSIPVPYYHSNVDSDEVMFYCGGDYEARKGSGIGQGSVSLHPGGHSHGPQPGAYERSIGVEFFDELAVMVDTFRPLRARRGRAGQRGRQVRLDLVGTRPGPRRMTATLLPTAVRPVLDDAAIFPPGNAPMADAVPDAHRRPGTQDIAGRSCAVRLLARPRRCRDSTAPLDSAARGARS